MPTEEELRKEHYDHFMRQIAAQATYEIRGMQVMGIAINLDNPDEVLAAYWLLKNTSWIEKEKK